MMNIRHKYEPTGMKVAVVDMIDYGTMNGEKVLNDALNHKEEIR